MTLAAKLGMIESEMRSRMSAYEWKKWIAYACMHPKEFFPEMTDQEPNIEQIARAMGADRGRTSNKSECSPGAG